MWELALDATYAVLALLCLLAGSLLVTAAYVVTVAYRLLYEAAFNVDMATEEGSPALLDKPEVLASLQSAQGKISTSLFLATAFYGAAIYLIGGISHG